MESNRCFSLFLLLLLSTLSAAVATTVAACTCTDPFVPPDCPVNFENLNYTIITSKCKGPEYPANICCSALKEFACPYAKYINDLNSYCALNMFHYIDLYGKYPPGLFSSLCSARRKVLLQCP